MSARLFDDGETLAARPERDGRDFYATHPSYATALLAALPAVWRARYGRAAVFPAVWEPAAGDGALARVLQAAGYRVLQSDIAPSGAGIPRADFLRAREAPAPVLITNPPYGRDLPLAFARHAMALGVSECWLLCRAAWWEAPGRFAKLKALPLRHIWVVNSRAAMWPAGRVPAGKENASWPYYHAWYGFVAGEAFAPQIDVIQPCPGIMHGAAP